MAKISASATRDIIIIVLSSISISMLIPNISYWKDRCISLQNENSNKTNEFQASLAFFTKKIDYLNEENKALKEENAILTNKFEDLQSNISISKDELPNELKDIKLSIDKVTAKLENQTVKIAEVKNDLNATENSISSDRDSLNQNKKGVYAGKIIFRDGTNTEFDWMGSNFSMGSWSHEIYYSKNNESKVYSQYISMSDISRIDFLDISEKEKEKDTESKWPIKANITFIDGKVWNNIYLYAVSWTYQNKYSSGWVLCRVVMWYQDEGYLNIKSIIFKR